MSLKLRVAIIGLAVLLAVSCSKQEGTGNTAESTDLNTESKNEAVQEDIDTTTQYTLKFSWADPNEPTKQSTSAYALVFKQELERLSGNQITVELYPAAQLGDQRSSVEQVAKGTIEMCNISSGVLASLYFEPLEIVDMPFLFSSREHARRSLDVDENEFVEKLASDCEEKTGIKILNLAPFGSRNMINSVREIKSPADMEGLKIRTMEIIPHMKLVESLGANPVPIPFSELYTSLQTNVVDGAENTLQNILAQKYYQVQDYLTMTGHVMGVGATLLNAEWYNSLPDHLKAALKEADSVAVDVYNGVGQLMDSVGAEALKEKGMQIYNPTPAEMKMFRDTAIPFVSEYMIDKFGEEFVSEFLDSVDVATESIESEI